MTRLDKIKEALQDLNPTYLEVIDDSALHQGHAGALTGKGHFTVKINSTMLQAKSRIEQHRLVYAALGSLMETDIHALSIQII